MTLPTSFLPDPLIEAALPAIRDRFSQYAGELAPGSELWNGLFDEAAARLFDRHIGAMGAGEGTLWLVDEAGEALVPAYNNGPDAASFVGKHRQPLEKGFVSVVFITQQGIAESFVYRNKGHDPSVNHLLGNVTVHMIAVPLYFGHDIRGVISAAKLRAPDATDPPEFETEAFDVANDLARVTGELLDARLVRLAMGGGLP